MSKSIIYSVIVPVYNEEAVILESYNKLKQVLDKLKEKYEMIFVNDGSFDKSAEILKEVSLLDKNVKIVNLSRNFGHQVAITAGMDSSSGEAIIIIDADLQDPPEVILSMVGKWKEGYQVVYGKRIERKGETIFKKITAKIFYNLINYLSDVHIPKDTGDFRLIDRQVCEALKSLPERNRFVRGLVSWVGFKQIGIEYVRDKRYAGTTKYPFKKMLKLSWDAATSFSYKPLKAATMVGMLISIGSFIYLLRVIYEKLFTDKTITGWSSIIAVNLLLDGVILLMLGIIGEYIGRIYEESKGRPLYIVSNKVGFEAEENKKDIQNAG